MYMYMYKHTYTYMIYVALDVYIYIYICIHIHTYIDYVGLCCPRLCRSGPEHRRVPCGQCYIMCVIVNFTVFLCVLYCCVLVVFVYGSLY